MSLKRGAWLWTLTMLFLLKKISWGTSLGLGRIKASTLIANHVAKTHLTTDREREWTRDRNWSYRGERRLELFFASCLVIPSIFSLLKERLAPIGIKLRDRQQNWLKLKHTIAHIAKAAKLQQQPMLTTPAAVGKTVNNSAWNLVISAQGNPNKISVQWRVTAGRSVWI